jgi:hypothetical protein
MKIPISKSISFILILLFISFHSNGADTLNYNVSFNYYRDLSDTYGAGATLFNGEAAFLKNWYGVGLSYGYYQSQSTHKIKILIEETNESFELPIEEMAIMQTSSVSGFIRPIQKEWIDVDIIVGTVFGKARHSMFKSVEYTYNLAENKITSLVRDYQLIKKHHFGYQVGFTISFFPIKNIGMQINARMQDLSTGGTFFLVGGGLGFRF